MRCHSGRVWYDTQDHAIGYAMHYSRSHDAVIQRLRCRWQSNRDARAQGRFPCVFELLTMTATHVAHRMHAAMESAEAGSKARAVTDTSCGSHLGSVAPAHL